jgi:hypothetical protein
MNLDSFKIDRNSLLLIVGIQEKIINTLSNPRRTEKRIIQLIESSKMFHIPIVLIELQPQLYGFTVKPVKNELPEYKPMETASFSLLKDEAVCDKLEPFSGRKIILSGVETHIGILQSCLDLLETGGTVHVPYDAVDSRNADDWKMGLKFMEKAGAVVTGSETIAYQLLKKCGTPEHKHLSKTFRESAQTERSG